MRSARERLQADASDRIGRDRVEGQMTRRWLILLSLLAHVGLGILFEAQTAALATVKR